MKKRNPERATFAELYQIYKPCLLRITGKNRNGDFVNGAAFHIGHGCLATARHVVDGVDVTEIVSSDSHCVSPVNIREMHFHENRDIDLAILETDFSLEHYMNSVMIIRVDGRLREKVDYIPIGSHLDYLMGDHFILSKAMLLGFPPIPRASRPVPFAVEVEVNAIIHRYDTPHPNFVISAVPRGGFSGGPVFSDSRFLLGIMTDSLYGAEQSHEAGFAAAITVEPLLQLIFSAGLECGKNSNLAKDLIGNTKPQIERMLREGSSNELKKA